MMQSIRIVPPSVIITDTKDILIFSDLFLSSDCHAGLSSVEQETQSEERKGVNLSNKLTPNYLTKRTREQIFN